MLEQRRTGSPARDLSFRAPSPATGDRRPGSGPPSPCSEKSATPPIEECPNDTPSLMTETFTVDKAKSFLRNLTSPHQFPSVLPSDEKGEVKGHRRQRSKDLSGECDDGKVHTHHRTSSHELNIPAHGDDAADRQPEESGRCSTPVLDGRKRPSSRPSSPMIFEGPNMEPKDTDPEHYPRKLTTAESLVQRLAPLHRKSHPPSPSNATSRVAEGEDTETKKSPQYDSVRSRKLSQSPESLPDSHDEALSTGTATTTRPTSLRQRTASVGSESDVVHAVGAGRKEANPVSSLLAKFQETILRDTSTRIRKRSNEEEDKSASRQSTGGSSRTRHRSESDNDHSDPGSHLPPKAPAHTSDSSSGSHSDDSKARPHRRHGRSPSDQRLLSSYSIDQQTGRHTHSPIIMEGGGKKSGSSVRRNASFHALLPSRPTDSQPGQAGEEVSSGGVQTVKKEEVAPQQEYQGKSSTSMRSRSPSPVRSRQPVLSGAQLKRQTSEPSAKAPP